MKTEQVINIHDLRKLLPERAQIEFRRKKGQTGRWYLEIEVSIKPSISEKEHDIVVQKIIEFYGEDCLEVYTEDTGRWVLCLSKNVFDCPNDRYTMTPSEFEAQFGDIGEDNIKEEEA